MAYEGISREAQVHDLLSEQAAAHLPALLDFGLVKAVWQQQSCGMTAVHLGDGLRSGRLLFTDGRLLGRLV